MDRAQKAIADRYYKGMMDFVSEGLAPPPAVVKSGELPLDEAVSQLMTLHDDCLAYVKKRLPKFETQVARFGSDTVEAPLLGELADLFGISVGDLREGRVRRDDPEATYDRRAQPRRATGDLDTTVLGAESDAEFAANGWTDPIVTIDGYATPYDPRLTLVRSRIALRHDGIAWVSLPRPQNFQVAYFDQLRVIHRQSGQWCLEFNDWRRRRIADRDEPAAWATFIDEVRRVSADVGFEWRSPDQALRDPVYDAVIYNVADWTEERRVALARSLVAAEISHRWAGSDLQVSNRDEKRVDRLIERL
jgi:hypothetical protein